MSLLAEGENPAKYIKVTSVDDMMSHTQHIYRKRDVCQRCEK